MSTAELLSKNNNKKKNEIGNLPQGSPATGKRKGFPDPLVSHRVSSTLYTE